MLLWGYLGYLVIYAALERENRASITVAFRQFVGDRRICSLEVMILGVTNASGRQHLGPSRRLGFASTLSRS